MSTLADTYRQLCRAIDDLPVIRMVRAQAKQLLAAGNDCKRLHPDAAEQTTRERWADYESALQEAMGGDCKRLQSEPPVWVTILDDSVRPDHQ
jgi:hypothetical protein